MAGLPESTGKNWHPMSNYPLLVPRLLLEDLQGSPEQQQQQQQQQD